MYLRWSLEEIRCFVWAKLWIEAFPTLIHDILSNNNCYTATTDCVDSYLNSSLRQYLSILAYQSLLSKHHYTTTFESIHNQHFQAADKNLIYGEIDPQSIAWCMSYICNYHIIQHGNPFVGEKIADFGSGSGKALLFASLTHPFTRAVGIEIVPSLHHLSCSLLDNTIRNEYLFLDQQQHGKTTFILLNEDLTCVDANIFSNAHVILIHATMFDKGLMDKVNKLCRICSDGTYFIMVSQSLHNDDDTNSNIFFETITREELSMSWGHSSVFIQRKRSLYKLMHI